MRTLTFSGSSDDIFQYEEKGGGDEAYAGSDDIAAYKIANDHGGLIVVGAYSPELAGNGCWAVGITLLDEDVRLPRLADAAWHSRQWLFGLSGY